MKKTTFVLKKNHSKREKRIKEDAN